MFNTSRKELIVNIFCVDNGIIPLLDVDHNHVKKTLAKMSCADRRKVTRKFKKILKKSLRHMARKKSDFSHAMTYEECLREVSLRAGVLEESRRNNLTPSQRNFRRHAVLQYITENC